MSAIKILHFSTYNEDCGIAKYQQHFIEGMSDVDDIQNTYFELSPNQTKNMSKEQLAQAIKKLADQMRDFDVLHIQHELSFFKQDELEQIISHHMRQLGKPVIVTVHTAPEVQYTQARLGGLGPKSILHYARAKRSNRTFIKRYIAPLRYATRIIVHNHATEQSLIAHSVPADRITVVRHPVQQASFTRESNEVRTALRHQPGDVIFCTVGFLSRAKGILQAVKALNYLPDNFKLVIAGGMHPDSESTEFYDEVADVIQHFGLKDRVYITGYIEDDEALDAVIRESDVCVYAYDKKYYSYVSSGSLNLAIANHRPVVAYATLSLVEVNAELPVIAFAKSPNYYELARTLRNLDIAKSAEVSKQYAALYAWDQEAVKFADIYRQVANK